MAVTPTYPGVYIEETAAIPHAVVPATTNLTAFVGPFSRGPLNEAVLVSSWPEFASLFGGLGPRASYSAYAVWQFFLNGGIGAWIVRVAPLTSSKPAKYAWTDTTPISPPQTPAAWIDITAANPGRWANNVKVTFQQSGPKARPYTGLADLVVSDAKSGTTLETVAGIPVPTVTAAADVKALQTAVAAAINASATLVTAKASAVIGKATTVQLQGGHDGEFDKPAPAPVAADATPAVDANAAPDPNAAPAAPPTPAPQAQAVSTAAPETLASAVQLQLADGGPLDQIAPQVFNLLCFPDLPGDDATFTSAHEYCEPRQAFVIFDPPAGDDAAAVQNWAMGKDILAPAYVAGAMYYPWVQITDPVTQLPKTVPPSGTVAGVYAATDVARGVWKAPAGTDASLRGVGALATLLSDTDTGALNIVGINCLRMFPLYGPVVWGARTLAGSELGGSAFKYVPSRRLSDFIEQSLQQSLRWAVFEPNGPSLWSSISLEVTSFMAGLFGQGAFAGASAAAAYQVVCDATTTSTADQLAGVVNVNVCFAPVDPAEFIMLNITIAAAAAAS